MASDKAAAAAAFEKGCDFGDAQSCRDLTSAQLPRSPESRVNALLQRACDLGDGFSCLSVGFRSHELSAFRKACESGISLGCVEVAHFALCSAEDREGARARYLNALDKACNDGLSRACMARFFASRPTDAAVPKALKTLKNACVVEKKVQACDALKLLKTDSPIDEIHTGEACHGAWSAQARRIARGVPAALAGCGSGQTFCGRGVPGAGTFTVEVGAQGEIIGMRAHSETASAPPPPELCAREVLSTLKFPPVPESCGPTELVFSFGSHGPDASSRPTPLPPESSSTGATEGLLKDEIAAVIRSHNKEVKACYEDALHLDNVATSVEGAVSAFFVIGPDGLVRTTAIAKSTVDDVILENCVSHVVKSMVFPRPRGGGTVGVTFPWILQPNIKLEPPQRAD